MRRCALLALAAVVAAGGCGEEPRLEASSARAMHRDVERVRTAAAAGDRDGALRALDALAGRVERRRDSGELGDADAAALLDRIDAAARRARSEIPEPSPAPEATAAPTAEPPEEPGTGDDEQKGKGESEGKGQDKDKDKDKGGDEGEGGDD
jgi:hypothetical protein